MFQQKVKYVAYFDTQDSKIKRNYVTSASNKVEYIAKAIASVGKEVEIISASEVSEDKFRFYWSEKKQISPGVSLRLPFSWGGNNGLFTKIKRIWHPLLLFMYLMLNCRSKDIVIVYHSLGYFNFIRWAKKLKGFRLILEVEEIYSDVSKMAPKWRNLEFRMFDIADAFMLSNDLLDEKINKHHKPFLVIYGSYQVPPKFVEKFNDGKIHVIYAGTFDPNKGGAQNAISAAEFLPSDYHVHICGFGTEDDICSVKKLIESAKAKSAATITYAGLKKGKEFVEFLQHCHIGLSTQNPEGDFNDTSFPSKVLTYMANGLHVVSIRIPVVERSSIGGYITYFEHQVPEDIASAIRLCHKSDYESAKELFCKLDKEFITKLTQLLQ